MAQKTALGQSTRSEQRPPSLGVGSITGYAGRQNAVSVLTNTLIYGIVVATKRRMPFRSALAWGWVFSFLLCLQAEDLASPSSYEGRPIAEIRYDPRSQPLVPADLARLVSFQIGAPLRLADVRAVIKRLYSSGAYSDIQIDTEPAGNGVALIIHTKEQWFAGPVQIHGDLNSPPNQAQLANASRLSLGQPFAEEDLEKALNNMQALFQRNGLYASSVGWKITRDAEHQQVSFTFQAHAGKRARLTTPIVKGDTKLPAAELAKAAGYHGWFGWKPATETNTQRGVENIGKKYEKADRLTASVELEGMERLPQQNRARPTIQADGGPKIQVQVTGAKLSKGKLHQYVPVFEERTVNQDLLLMGVRNLRDYFQDRGYFDVQVELRTQQTNPDLETITYVVGLGERRILARVNIRGNHYFQTSQIRERIFLRQNGFIRLRYGRYSEGLAHRDEQAIEALYRDNGFQDCKVTTTVQDDYRNRKDEIAVTLNIDEGPQYLVSSLTVDGVTLPNKKQILSHLASEKGQPYSQTNVAVDRDYILGFYQSAGYLDATFDSHTEPGPGPQEVNVRYVITQGRSMFVREVLVSGLDLTRPSLVNGNMLLKPGDPLSWTTMGAMQRRLYDLGIFEKVDMAIQNPSGDTEHKYLLYQVTEAHRFYVTLGLGAEVARFGGNQYSLDNPAGTTGFSPSVSLDVRRLNLWGLGHTVDVRARYSTLDRRASVSYIVPRFQQTSGHEISFTALYDNTRDVVTYTAWRYEGSAQYSQRFSKALTALFRYTWRDVQVGTVKIEPLLIPLLSQPAHIGALSANFIHDRRDNAANTHSGIYNSLELSLAEHDFGGNKNFTRVLARNSYYKPILFCNCVLASNTQFGWIHPINVPAGISPENYIPLPERFFGGGNSSDRGFPDFQAGPRDPETGFPIGGNALLFHSTEFRFPLSGPDIDGVLFHDMGNVYSQLNSISFRVNQNGLTDFNYMVHAVGFGIRYRTPVGPVRLDLAYSINPPTFNGLNGTYQQLLFGTATPAIQSISHFQFFFSIGQAF
jgi:outer membrane protein insertion porin family